MSIADEILTDFNVYCDESAVSNQRYLVIGGIWLPRHLDQRVRASLASVRIAHKLQNEMKWTRVSKAFLKQYEDFVSVFFTYPELQFNCIVIDMLLVDHRKFNQNDKELGFYKFYYRMLNQNIEGYNQYWIYTDRKYNRDRFRLSDLFRILNNRKDALPGRPPVRHLQPLDSKVDDLLQLADLLLGCVQCHYNGDTIAEAKLAFAKFVATSFGFTTLKTQTSRRHRPICIWKWKPGRTDYP